VLSAARIGKTVKIRCGPAAVTGDEFRIQATLLLPVQQWKARKENEPEARRPARYSVE